MRRDADQQINMFAIHRSSLEHHLLATGDFSKQLTASLTHTTPNYLIPLFRRPHQMILAVPHRKAATIVVFLPIKPSPIRRLKAGVYRFPVEESKTTDAGNPCDPTSTVSGKRNTTQYG